MGNYDFQNTLGPHRDHESEQPDPVENKGQTCISCPNVGKSFNSAYDGRWLVLCNHTDNKESGGRRPHEICEHHPSKE